MKDFWLIRGDREAFTALYDRYHLRVFRTALHLVHDPSLAEDITQEVFIAHVAIMYYSSAFSRGSWIGTEGTPKDIQEVKVGSKSGMAYRDDRGWKVWWTLNGHQYTVMTDLPLEEALKVADSIK